VWLSEKLQMNKDKLNKLIIVRTGGKGSVRRKKKFKRNNNRVPSDTCHYYCTSTRSLGVNEIPHIEEIAMFYDNGAVRIFKKPKLQASLSANMYVLTGQSEVKSMMYQQQIL